MILFQTNITPNNSISTGHVTLPLPPRIFVYNNQSLYSPCRLLKKIECVSLITKWSSSTRVSPGVVDEGAPAPVANAARARRPSDKRAGENMFGAGRQAAVRK